MKPRDARIGIPSVIVILSLIGVACRQQDGTAGRDEAVAAQEAEVSPVAPAEPVQQAKDEKCPVFTITSEAAPGSVTFTVNPAREELTYSWSVSTGTVVSGSGTASIMVDVPNAAENVLVSLDVLGLDASCPRETGYVTGSAQVP